MKTEYIEMVNGAPVLLKHTCPIPLYEVGMVVHYKEDANGKEHTALIEGYSVDVFRFDTKDGKKSMDYSVIYYVSGPDTKQGETDRVNEEFITGAIDPDEEEAV